MMGKVFTVTAGPFMASLESRLSGLGMAASRIPMHFTLFNNSASNYVKVLRIESPPIHLQADDPTAPRTPWRYTQRLAYISAASGGTAVTAIAHDTSASALPSQVKVLAGAAVTVSTDNVAQRLVASLGRDPDTALFGTAPQLLVDCAGMRHTNRMFLSQGYGTLDPVVLREGEGIALLDSVSSCPEFYQHYLTLNDGTNTYSFSCQGVPGMDTLDAPLCVINESGSGKVIYITEWDAGPIGTGMFATSGVATAPQMNPVFLAKVLAAPRVNDYGTALSPVAFDTNDVVPSGIECYRGSQVYTADSGVFFMQTPYSFQIAGGNQLAGENASLMDHRDAFVKRKEANLKCVAGYPAGLYTWDVYKAGDQETPVVVRNGECLVVHTSGWSEVYAQGATHNRLANPQNVNNFDVVVTFETEVNPATGGGGLLTHPGMSGGMRA